MSAKKHSRLLVWLRNMTVTMILLLSNCLIGCYPPFWCMTSMLCYASSIHIFGCMSNYLFSGTNINKIHFPSGIGLREEGGRAYADLSMTDI